MAAAQTEPVRLRPEAPATSEPPFGIDPGCPVHCFTARVSSRMPDVECAMVFRVPDRIAAIVEHLRSELHAQAPPEEQLTPHVTVLHMGVQRADDLGRLPSTIWSPLDVMVRIDGFGTFWTKCGRVNLHLRLTPWAPLAAAQLKLISAAAQLNAGQFSPFIGPRYIPHVTVWDQAQPGPWLACAAQVLELPQEPFRLSDLVLIYRPPRT